MHELCIQLLLIADWLKWQSIKSGFNYETGYAEGHSACSDTAIKYVTSEC